MQNRPNATAATIVDVVDAVKSNLPTLAHGEPYSLEQLVGEESWDTIPKGHRTNLSGCSTNQRLSSMPESI